MVTVELELLVKNQNGGEITKQVWGGVDAIVIAVCMISEIISALVINIQKKSL